MIKFRMTLSGTAPLLMHNSRLANPLDPATKAVKRLTGKRKKTDEDHEEIAHLEFLGSLYLDSDVGPYVPGENIGRCLVDAGRISKRGVLVTRGVFIETDVNPLAYDGPRDPEKLWADANYQLMASVKVGMQRTMRCRPMFRQWSADAEGTLDPNVLDFTDLADIAQTAGSMIGIGDWRPRYGRFQATLERL